MLPTFAEGRSKKLRFGKRGSVVVVITTWLWQSLVITTWLWKKFILRRIRRRRGPRGLEGVIVGGEAAVHGVGNHSNVGKENFKC